MLVHSWPRQVVTLVLCLAAASTAGAQRAPDVTISDGRGGGLRMLVFSAPYRATSARASVLVGVEVHGLLEQREGRESRTPANASTPRRLELRFAVISGPAGVPEQAIAVPLGDEASRQLADREGAR